MHNEYGKNGKRIVKHRPPEVTPFGIKPGVKIEVTPIGYRSTEELAKDLATQLGAAANLQAESVSYRREAVLARQNMAKTQRLIGEVVAWRKNPPENVRRMDPMSDYDIETLNAERQRFAENEQLFNEMAIEANKKAQEQRVMAESTQKQIHDRR